MSNGLGLIELVLVLSAGVAWGIFELRSLRRSRKPRDAVAPHSDPDRPCD